MDSFDQEKDYYEIVGQKASDRKKLIDALNKKSNNKSINMQNTGQRAVVTNSYSSRACLIQ